MQTTRVFKNGNSQAVRIPVALAYPDMDVELVRYQPESVAKKFAQCRLGDIIMSAITFAELEYGVAACANPEREATVLAALTRRIKVAPFDQHSAKAYGAVRLATRERKSDHLDKLIAAHAISLNVVLVTNNTRDFAAYPGLVLENWTQSVH